uniref:Alpha-amylase/branching enzyme C-terminal all beta domain-containing protein n=1 Tax=Glossina palpalis gambiensis TaxID=67801 RepID=A0A1B0BEE0_9MUSC
MKVDLDYHRLWLKVIAYERDGIVFNFHPTKRFTNYCVDANWPGIYKVPLITDDKIYGVVARERAPSAKGLYMTGDFNNWQWKAEPFQKLEFDKWELQLPPNADVAPAVKHLSDIKIIVRKEKWQQLHRLSPCAVYYPGAKRYKSLRIYECHVVIASQEPFSASYDRFTTEVIPRIKRQGYRATQNMLNNASFGYQVTTFFAASNQYGTPEQLKGMIDVAPENVHSHTSKNVQDDLNQFDDTNNCYFQDGLRDGGMKTITSTSFSGDYNENFGTNVDTNALNYLAFANCMPTLCRPISEAAIGFEYQLGILEKWIQLLPGI